MNRQKFDNTNKKRIDPTLPRNVELKLKVNSFSIEIENESGVISIYTFDPTSN